jgi:hypothetical protein
MVRAGHKRRMAAFAVEGGLCCGRAVCRYLGLSRATYRYRSRLVARIHALSAAHPRFGFRRIVALLRREGWSVSRKQVQRVRRAEGLRVPPPRKRQTRRGRSTGLPTRATHRGHVWTCDFIADATVHGGALRMLTVLDEHTKEAHVLRPERRISSADAISLLEAALAEHGAPEFIAKELQLWLAKHKIKTIYIIPAEPLEKRVCRKLPQPLPRRMPLSRATVDTHRSTCRH